MDTKKYLKIMDSFENNQTKSITTLVKKNRQNDFLNFLIVLADKHYLKKWWTGKCLYDDLLEQDFPGDIKIINQNDLQNIQEQNIQEQNIQEQNIQKQNIQEQNIQKQNIQEQNIQKQKSQDYIIKDAVVLKKLYIRLPKENLYIDSSKYEEYLLNSITNEFLRIISTLKPMSIKLKIFNQNNNEIEFDMNTSISFQGIDVGSDVKNQQTNNSNNTKEWLLTFRKTNSRIDLSCFLDKTKFYYLPKYVEWTDLIHNRVNYNVNTAKYVYEHTIDNNIDIGFVEKMKVLNIECKYKKSKYENLRFEYEIDYYPL